MRVWAAGFTVREMYAAASAVLHAPIPVRNRPSTTSHTAPKWPASPYNRLPTIWIPIVPR
jgi:hypothetical protein